jgi:hypothetical protein
MPGKLNVMENIVFHEEDLKNARDLVDNSIVVCLHGCNDINRIAIEMALSSNKQSDSSSRTSSSSISGWVVMPCCIQKDMYLHSSCHVDLSDDNARYHLLCGALAMNYGAQLIGSIDARITNRNILIAGGIGDQTSIGEDVLSSNNSPKNSRIRRIPKLIFS